MRYLVTSNDNPPFRTALFDPENHWVEDVGMVVYDLDKGVFTTDGQKWQEIETDFY